MTSGDDLLKKPIVIVGAPRSGTTLLGSVLEAHPHLHYVVEPRILWKFGNDQKSDVLAADDARPDVCRHIRREFARQVREAGRQRLLEKTPSNSLRLEFVDRVLPDCIFVHVMRDGLQSVLSIRRYWEQHATGVRADRVWQRLKEMRLRQWPHYGREFLRRALAPHLGGAVGPAVWGPRLPGMDQMLRDLGLLETCAMQWRMCVERACRFGRTLPPDRYLECRLEDIGEDLLRQIMHFCQLPDSPEVIADFKSHFDPTQPGGRTLDADPAEIELVRRLIEPTKVWLETTGLTTPTGGESTLLPPY